MVLVLLTQNTPEVEVYNFYNYEMVLYIISEDDLDDVRSFNLHVLSIKALSKWFSGCLYTKQWIENSKKWHACRILTSIALGLKKTCCLVWWNMEFSELSIGYIRIKPCHMGRFKTKFECSKTVQNIFFMSLSLMVKCRCAYWIDLLLLCN